jgi:hypothetical protein
MSKKLIAVAAAAALALTGLVATPANASTITQVVVTHGGTAGATEDAGNSTTLTTSQTSSTSALTIASDNTDRKVYFGGSTDAVTRTSVRAVVTMGAAGSLTITPTAGVRVAASVTDADGKAISAVDGGSATSISGSTVTGALTYTFYAWTTSSTAGSVTVESAGSRIVFYLKAKTGPAYNLTDVTFPASLYTGQTDAKVTAKLTDQWGNAVSTGTAPVISGFGMSGTMAYSATKKLWESTLTSVTGDNVAINVAITDNDLSANGFAKPVTSAFKLVSSGNLATQNAALTAQVTALTAQVAALQAQLEASRPKATSVTKKRYNTLARKWNAANPGSRVALKK